MGGLGSNFLPAAVKHIRNVLVGLERTIPQLDLWAGPE
jgi:hypothetical protein